MKRTILSFFSILISCTFAIGLSFIVVQIIRYPSRNFGIIFVLPLLVSLIDYSYLAFCLIKNKLSGTKIKAVFILALIQFSLPIAIWMLWLSPMLFVSFIKTSFLIPVILFLPALFLILPAYLFWDNLH